jgi:para-aminobenzoate synthetase component 1
LASPVLIHVLDPALTVALAVKAFRNECLLTVLDSTGQHRDRDARWSFLTADPLAIERLDAVAFGEQPFETLRSWAARLREATGDGCEAAPPFFGGIAGLLSYELGGVFERLPATPRNALTTPALLAGLFDWAIVWDHLAATVTAFALSLQCPAGQPRPAGNSARTAAERLEWICAKLSSLEQHVTANGVRDASRLPEKIPPGHRVEPGTNVTSNFSRGGYLAAVERVIEYIRAGDIFQANLSQQLSASWNASAVDLFLRVRERNPAPFSGLLDAGDFAVISASPERFLKVDSTGHVETRPIKGTRRRSQSPIADLYTAGELSASVKDRSENVMIVDLLRNDLSRSCATGSVRVTGLCEVERFETVLHLVSTVEGRLRHGCDVWDLLAGCFPGGSVTGAPKIRAMQIIAELEQAARGAYCGSLFAMGPRGDFDSSILIRTITLKSGLARFPVGGGIVADSNPLDEYRETLHKASGLLRCLHEPADGSTS